MVELTLTLPFPPSVNTYWRHVVLGKPPKQRAATLLSEKGREYKKAVLRAVIAQRAAKGIRGEVHVVIKFFAPDNRRRDVDNYPKALLDGLVEAGVMKDDSLVRDLRLAWGEVTPGGKAVVTIRTMAVPPEQGKLV